MVDFLFIFVLSRSGEILVESNYWLVMYVSNIVNSEKAGNDFVCLYCGIVDRKLL